MTTPAAGASITRLPVRHEQTRDPETLILVATLWRSGGDLHRHIGVDDSMTLAEFHDVVGICFSLPDTNAPFTFVASDLIQDQSVQLHTVLSRPGDSLTYFWGLWRLDFDLIEAYPRDKGTPKALCIGGSGLLGSTTSADMDMGEDFDTALVNARLTGTETIEKTLDLAQPGVVSVINRSGIFDFIPLLQALDLEKPISIDEKTKRILCRLPVEESQFAKDAFWATMLALSSLAGAETGNEVIEATMEELGWTNDDGTLLTATAIRALIPKSLQLLTAVGGYGTTAKSPVVRLDLYRQILKADRS